MVLIVHPGVPGVIPEPRAGLAGGRRKINLDNLGTHVLKDTGNISGEEMRCGRVGGDIRPLHGT